MLAVLLSGYMSFGMAGGGKDGEKNNSLKNSLYIENICNEVNTTFLNSTKIDIIDADNYGLDNTIPKDTRDAIYSILTYPEFARENIEDGVVFVNFTYDEDGYIKIRSTNYSDEQLNKYIVDKLENIRLRNGIVTIGKEYHLKFHFELL